MNLNESINDNIKNLELELTKYVEFLRCTAYTWN